MKAPGTICVRALAAAVSACELYWMIVLAEGATALPVPMTSKWLWVSERAACAARPAVAVAFRTLIPIFAALSAAVAGAAGVAGPCAAVPGFAVPELFGLATDWSCAIALYSWEACG